VSLFGKIWRAFLGKRSKGQLHWWRSSEEREIKRPRDRRTKFCVANIGKAITIKYHGKPRTITPLRVFTKPQFRKTYVEAREHGMRKTFDIDDITLVRAKRKK
jgi:hypothetical protein